jgi:hypothetical protein
MLFLCNRQEQEARSESIQERGVKEGRKIRRGEERKGVISSRPKIIIPYP